MREGEILDFQGSWHSGLATLVVRDPSGRVQRIPCDNAPTVRALDAAFGGVITEGHCVDVESIRGQWIRYGMDDLGLVLGWIEPITRRARRCQKMR